MPNRLLVIGLDSAPLPWLARWIAEGRLPNLGRILSNGAVGTLQSVIPPISPAAWCSFATGKYPGKHGVFDHIYRRPGSYDIAPTNSTSRLAIPFWDIISQGGGKVGIVNVPETYPPSPVNGFMISGMDTPSDEAEFAFPSSLKQELEQAIGGYRVFGLRSKENLDKSIAGMHETIPMRARAGQHLWEKYLPDLMTLVFMETDVIQHKCWKYLDPQHPDFDPHVSSSNGTAYAEAVPDIYARIDAALGPWLANLDHETTVIVMSDHGAGPLRKFLHINNWLIQEGFLDTKQTALGRIKRLAFHLGLSPENMFDLAARLGIGLADGATNKIKRDMVAREGTTLLQRAFLSWSDIDWANTKAYTLGGNFTGIYLNVRGREPHGFVSPGQEYEKTRHEIAAKLKEWRDPEFEEAVVDQIIFREELYSGPYAQLAPDLIFTTNSELYVGSGGHEFASNRLMSRSSLFNGHHRLDGMVAISGPGIRQAAIRRHAIVDLAPTILYLLGYEIPADLDGKVMTDAMTPDLLARQAIRIGPATGQSDQTAVGKQVYSGTEQEEILQRLSDLGYF